MAQKVIIKSNKYGINLILDSEIKFQEILDAVTAKFKESSRFFKDSNMAISFEGRELSQEEEEQIIDKITEVASINIVCIMDRDQERESRMREQVENYYNKQVEQQYMESVRGNGVFHKGTLRSGQMIESEANVTILGDVNPGAKIVSGGNIIIIGSLKGNAHAGAYDNENCFVFALDMKPIQIQIGQLIAKSPDKQKEKRRLIRRTKEETEEAQIAIAREGSIYIEPVTKNILSDI